MSWRLLVFGCSMVVSGALLIGVARGYARRYRRHLEACLEADLKRATERSPRLWEGGSI